MVSVYLIIIICKLYSIYSKHMTKAVRSNETSIPSFEKIKSSVYRALENDRPINPKSAQDVDIKGELAKTINGSNFLLNDIKDKEGRILVRTYIIAFLKFYLKIKNIRFNFFCFGTHNLFFVLLIYVDK